MSDGGERLRRLDYDGRPAVMFKCPGCKYPHLLHVDSGPSPAWTWNGSLTRPTLTPSILGDSLPRGRCHSFVRDGRIQFLADCQHELAGKTVDLPEIPADATIGDFVE